MVAFLNEQTDSDDLPPAQFQRFEPFWKGAL